MQLSRVGNDIVFHYSATDQITVKDWFVTRDAQIERVAFADGTVSGHQ